MAPLLKRGDIEPKRSNILYTYSRPCTPFSSKRPRGHCCLPTAGSVCVSVQSCAPMSPSFFASQCRAVHNTNAQASCELCFGVLQYFI